MMMPNVPRLNNNFSQHHMDPDNFYSQAMDSMQRSGGMGYNAGRPMMQMNNQNMQ